MEAYSWYTDSDAFATIIIKPKYWRVSIRNLLETDKMVVPADIPKVGVAQPDSSFSGYYYDLTGRSVLSPQ